MWTRYLTKKAPFISKTYIRYRLYSRGTRSFHIEGFFFKKNFYYLMLDPAKRTNYNFINRASTILDCFVGELVRVYSGRLWRTFYITPWHVGFKLGEFCKTRRRAVFRVKMIRKKMKSRKKSIMHELKIKKIKTLKSGKFKKNRLLTVSGGIAL